MLLTGLLLLLSHALRAQCPAASLPQQFIVTKRLTFPPQFSISSIDQNRLGKVQRTKIASSIVHVSSYVWRDSQDNVVATARGIPPLHVFNCDGQRIGTIGKNVILDAHGNELANFYRPENQPDIVIITRGGVEVADLHWPRHRRPGKWNATIYDPQAIDGHLLVMLGVFQADQLDIQNQPARPTN